MLPALFLKEARLGCALPTEHMEAKVMPREKTPAFEPDSEESEEETSGYLFKRRTSDKKVPPPPSGSARSSVSTPSSRSSTSYSKVVFNTPEFWAEYEPGKMAHFYQALDRKTTRMAVTTVHKSTKKAGPAYYQKKNNKTGTLYWSKVKSWYIDNGALYVELPRPEFPQLVGLGAELIQWHTF